MAFKTHKVAKYNYSFGARTGNSSLLQLWGINGNEILNVKFIDDNVTIPPPVIANDLSKAKVSFKRSSQMALIDMLRNENPVSVTINNQNPGFVFIGTGSEPVGEGED